MDESAKSAFRADKKRIHAGEKISEMKQPRLRKKMPNDHQATVPILRSIGCVTSRTECHRLDFVICVIAGLFDWLFSVIIHERHCNRLSGSCLCSDRRSMSLRAIVVTKECTLHRSLPRLIVTFMYH